MSAKVVKLVYLVPVYVVMFQIIAMIASDDFVLSSSLIKVCLAIYTAAYLLNHHTCVIK